GNGNRKAHCDREREREAEDHIRIGLRARIVLSRHSNRPRRADVRRRHAEPRCKLRFGTLDIHLELHDLAVELKTLRLQIRSNLAGPRSADARREDIALRPKGDELLRQLRDLGLECLDGRALRALCSQLLQERPRRRQARLLSESWHGRSYGLPEWDVSA